MRLGHLALCFFLACSASPPPRCLVVVLLLLLLNWRAHSVEGGTCGLWIPVGNPFVAAGHTPMNSTSCGGCFFFGRAPAE
jgi:hypothetical protein